MAMAISLASVDGTFFPSSRPQGFYPFRALKRRTKLKPTIRPRKLDLYRICNQLDPANSPSRFDDFFQGLLSHLPHPSNPLPLAAFGFASGLAFSLPDKLNLKQTNQKTSKGHQFSNFGEWILFTSPTPFNRFVLLRCPSLLFEDGEFLEDVNDRLVKQERHFVSLDSGKIQLRTGIDGNNDEEGPAERARKPLLEYSRICVQTDDGGVVSLDWPANLDLNEERGLDSTILLIPGSPEGSMAENVRSFAFECLKKGFFPIVMNPRGCAGSPLTTPRLFSAADSDDISSAIRFLSRARPWSTFMGVGWGYGANMLTKYLAGVGETTPLTAAACIDNPFDLEEATRSCTASNAISEKLLEGLKDILRSNKELFQGRSKTFDVEKALTAESVRDFDSAVSMVSYGFETVEEFYEKSSTRYVVGDLKVPVLFIQSDDGTVPLFSVPRGMIAENPFSSLLLCSSSPSNAAESVNLVMSWSQELAVEWLAAVELALLKGRHPLLKDLDVTVNPSTGLALVDGWASDEDESNGVLDITRSDNVSGYMFNPLKEDPGADHASNLRCIEDVDENGYKDIRQETYASHHEAGVVHEESADEAAAEKGQVLQTAHVVMHMLDVTMPGTLKEEDKAKVLDAVGQGETLIKALQDAVPEDVRGRLTSSVNEILQTHGKNLNFDAFNIDKIANISSDLKTRIESKLTRKTSDENKNSDGTSLDQKKPLNDHCQTQEKVTKSSDVDDSESVNQHVDPASEKKDTDETQNILGNNDRSALPFEHNENSHEPPDNANPPIPPVRPGRQEEGSIKKDRCQNGELAQQNMEQDIDSGADFRSQGLPEDKSRKISGTGVDEAMAPANPPDINLSEKQDDGCNEREESRSLSEDKSRKIMATGVDEAVASSNPRETNLSEKQNDGGNKREESQSLSEDKSRKTLATGVNEAVAPANPTDTHLSGKQDDDGEKRDERSFQMNPELYKPTSIPNSPSFSVSQALDALTDLDDSTQVAVNSVFGVIEEMINHLENKKESDETERVENVAVNGHLGSALKDVKDPVETSEDGINAPPVSIIPINGNGIDAPVGSSTTGVAGKGKADELSTKNLEVETLDGDANANGHPILVVNADPGSLQHDDMSRSLVSKLKKAKSLNVDMTATLSLHYIPEEKQWKLPGQQDCNSVGNYEAPNEIDNTYREVGIVGNSSEKHTVIEPSYKIIDLERQNENVEKFEKRARLSGDDSNIEKTLDQSAKLIKGVVLQSLKIEVVRRLSMYGTKEIHPVLASEIDEVANVVSMAVWQEKEHTWCPSTDNLTNSGQFDGGHIIEVISTAVKNTRYLRQILPVGVIVGSSLASLRKFYNVVSLDREYQHEDWDLHDATPKTQLLETEASWPLPSDENGNSFPDEQQRRDGESINSEIPKEMKNNLGRNEGPFDRDSVMVGAVTAALGASALMAHEQDDDGTSVTGQSQLKSIEKIGNLKRSLTSKWEAAEEKPQTNIVSSLAEKAMSVAAPVVPTKEDGELDHERMVTMLTELGQKGGMLRLVGKLALLWGGIRGAMSLTDRLIKFLRLAERPLAQRILGFICMVLVLWSPVVLPLIPTLVYNWTTKNTSRVVQFACITGFYAAAALLIVIWGKRIRGYENPLQKYGLDLVSPHKIQEYLSGLAGGIILVLLIHAANVSLGFVDVNWPSSFSASDAGMVERVRSWGKLLGIAAQGIVTATFISSVEELVYRSWLPEEISADLGYHRAVILSALAFSLSQRSLQTIPGLWLLSLFLAGLRQRKLGSLYSPIGLRTGVIASCYVLRTGALLINKPNMPRWLTGTNAFQPFSGAVGLLFSLILATMMYPRQPISRKNMPRTIRE